MNLIIILKTCSVRTDLTEEGANSTLSVAKINKSDSGNYTCSIGPTHSFTTTVHVLNGKSRQSFLILLFRFSNFFPLVNIYFRRVL